MNIHYNSNIFIDILDKMMGKREPSILEESERYPGGGEGSERKRTYIVPKTTFIKMLHSKFISVVFTHAVQLYLASFVILVA